MLTKRFAIKVTAIEETKDVSTTKLEEIIRSLGYFKMTLESEECPSKKDKNFALKIVNQNLEEEQEKDDEDLNKLL